MEIPPFITRYWGKAKPALDEGPRWHPLAYHSLDVAAVGQVLLEHPPWRQRLARLTKLPEEAAARWAVFFLANHDVGKICDGFQGLVPDLMQQLQLRKGTQANRPHHSTTGALLWKDCLGKRLPEAVQRRYSGRARHWVAAACGHHGLPPDLGAQLGHQLGPGVEADLLAWFDATVALLPFPSEPLPETSAAASWWLAGWAVLADWAGSNQAWFEYVAPTHTLGDYWHTHALPKARAAVADLGLLGATPRPFSGITQLFEKVTTPTALQRVAATHPIPERPTLVLLEDRTGAGKTEAAFTLAARWLAAGKGEGIFVALPTMATANAMHLRLHELPGRLFTGAAHLQLAHGARELVPLLRSLAEQAVDEKYEASTNDASATTEGARWLADSNKKALLAHLGVGTIDQLLLAILPVKHQSLRLLGASRSVLIVDEVHACDDYVHVLLQKVLEFHARLGGSAILLSATLPRQQRQALLTAFAKGADYAPVAPVSSMAYPLLTELSSSQPCEVPVVFQAGDRPVERPPVAVTLTHDAADVEARITAALAAGQCVCWIRNTIHDAHEAFARWRARHPETHLFHSRYLLGDRLAIEDRVLGLFGEKSTPTQRWGQLLIATQVVEQSLDLDFDFMVSDLAPIDLLIQRAGRLHRHPEKRPQRTFGPELLVLSPEPTLDAPRDWYARLFPKGQYVYPRHDALWHTARRLVDHPHLTIPRDARDLIEAVYNPGQDAPADLLPGADRAMGKELTHRAIAHGNACTLDTGYALDGGLWGPDTSTPTRLGEDTVTLRFARREGPHRVPLIDVPQRGGAPEEGPQEKISSSMHWELSGLRVARRLIDASTAEDLAALGDTRPLIKDPERIVLITLKKSGTEWVGQAIQKGQPVTVRYDEKMGLRLAAHPAKQSLGEEE
jgi:CRISPR-associated endonuclease/helicase Cas3